MSNEGFMLSTDDAIEFFERCQKLNPDTRETRIELLRIMTKENKIYSLSRGVYEE